MIVNILTIHKEPNYGAILQAYALYKKIEDLGYTPRLINVRLDFRRKKYNLINKILLVIYRRIKGYSHCYNIAENFINKYCPNQTKNFYSYDEIRKYNWNKNDIYIVGSDQVWNPSLTGKLFHVYSLTFLSNEYKKYSYASSFGHIDEKRLDETMIKSIGSFKRISVREKFGVDFLKNKGIISQEVIDPTLLLNNYKSFINNDITTENKIVFLSLSDTKDMNDFVDKISRENNIRIEKHYGYLQPQRKENKKFLSVENWLNAIYSSSTVITDSYHATIFSILLKKEFYVYISNASKVYRIQNLLDNLGIKNRIVNRESNIDLSDKIEYQEIDKKINNFRKESVDFLKSILNENSNM